MDVNCYTTAVGLASCACPCLTDQAPENYNTSDSGLYITDLSPLNALDGLDDCNTPGNLWEVLADCRDRAIRSFIAATNSLLAQTNRMSRERYVGGIGQIKGRNVVTPAGTYAGVRIRCAPVKSGTLYIEKIGGVFDTSGTVNVKIYNQFNTQLGTVGGYNITTVAGQHAQVTVGLSLPTWTEWADVAEYFISYTVNPSNLPRENKVTCGCGGFNPLFNTTTPYDDRAKNDRAWTAWLKVGGWTGDSLTDFDEISNEVTASTYTYGLTLQVRLECDPGAALCSGTLNFSDPLALSMAEAIQYKAACLVADKILTATGISRYNLINRETLIEAKKAWNQAFIETTQYIAANADPKLAGCMECKPAIGMKMQNVLS